MTELDRLLTTDEVAELLRLQPQTVRKWRSLSVGPRFYRTDRGTVRYRLGDVQHYARNGR